MRAWIRKMSLAAAVLLAPASALAQQTITVTGQGSASAAPDTAMIEIGVQVLRPTSEEALNDAAERANAVLQAIRNAGVAREDIQTRHVSVNPSYDFRNGQRILRGYEAMHLVSAQTRDVSQAGPIIDAAVRAGEDEAVVQGIRFGLENDEAVRREARAEAWRDARDRAQHLADLAGVQLRRAISIQEQVGPIYGPPIAYARAEALDASTPVQPGEIEVQVTLVVEWQVR